MVKNGLFLISIGFLIFVVGAMGANMRLESPLALVFAVVFVLLGLAVAYKGHKNFQAKKKEEEQTNEANENS